MITMTSNLTVRLKPHSVKLKEVLAAKRLFLDTTYQVIFIQELQGELTFFIADANNDFIPVAIGDCLYVNTQIPCIRPEQENSVIEEPQPESPDPDNTNIPEEAEAPRSRRGRVNNE